MQNQLAQLKVAVVMLSAKLDGLGVLRGGSGAVRPNLGELNHMSFTQKRRLGVLRDGLHPIKLDKKKKRKLGLA